MTRVKDNEQFEVDVDQLYATVTKTKSGSRVKQLGKSLSVLAAAGTVGFVADEVCVGAVVSSGPQNIVVQNDYTFLDLDDNGVDDFGVLHYGFQSGTESSSLQILARGNW